MDFEVPLRPYQSLTAQEQQSGIKKMLVRCVRTEGTASSPTPRKYIRGLVAAVALAADFARENRSEARALGSDSAIHHAMLFDLKSGYFFINNFATPPHGSNRT